MKLSTALLLCAAVKHSNRMLQVLSLFQHSIVFFVNYFIDNQDTIQILNIINKKKRRYVKVKFVYDNGSTCLFLMYYTIKAVKRRFNTWSFRKS